MVRFLVVLFSQGCFDMGVGFKRFECVDVTNGNSKNIEFFYEGVLAENEWEKMPFQ